MLINDNKQALITLGGLSIGTILIIAWMMGIIFRATACS